MTQLPALSLDLSLLQPGDRVLAAVSGGADSLALLHALASRRADLRIEVVALHVHHGMRGQEADADVHFLEETCRSWQVPLSVEKWDVPLLAKERRISVEEAGRIARYAAFSKGARERGSGKVATAHTADDQAETVLLNLFRGTGIDGLAGIPPRRSLGPEPGAPEVVRPLLRCWRREIEAYCAAHGLEPREDRTNRDLRYRRSRLRHELLPHLAQYEPHVKERLVRIAGHAQEEAELLRPQAEALLREAALPSSGPALPFLPFISPAVALNRLTLAAAPPALARRALRLLLRQIAGYAVEMDAALIERLMLLIRGEGPAAVDLPGSQWRARRVEERLLFEPVALSPVQVPEPVAAPSVGVLEAARFGIRLEVEEVPVPADPRSPPEEARMDADSLRMPLTLRAPQRGDRFRPLGAPGTRLLSDFFNDRKVPREQRPVWPLLVDCEGIVWVVGLALADRVKVHAGTRRCLWVTAGPLAQG